MSRGERTLIYITVVGMELSWLHIVFSLFAGLFGIRTPVYLLFPVYGVSFMANWFLGRVSLRPRNRILLNLALATACALLLLKVLMLRGSSLSDLLLSIPRALWQIPEGINTELALFIGSFLLWWLGYRLSKLKIDFALAVAEFQFGIGVALFFLFLASQIPVEMPLAVPVVVSFFLFALLGVSVSHASSGVSWLTSRMRGYWMGLLILTIIFIVIVSLALAAAFTPDVIRTILTPVRWLLATVDRIGLAVADFLLKIMRPPELPPDVVIQPPSPEPEGPDMWEFFGMSVRLRDILRFIMGCFWMVMITIGIWQFSQWLLAELRKRLASSGAEIEHLDGAFKADILGFIRKLLTRLLNFRLFLRRQKLTGTSEIDAVRGIYRELLTWAKRKGFPRLYFQTPSEYLYTLSGVIPAAEGELRFLTEHYMNSRYGALLPAEGDINQLKVSWQRIKKTPLEKKSERPSGHRVGRQTGDIV